MNRYKTFFSICSVCLALSGCANKEEKIDIKGYSLEYKNECNALVTKEYEHINLEDALFIEFPLANEVGIYTQKTPEISADSSISTIKNIIANYGYDNFDYENELRDASGQYASNDNNNYPYNYPAVYDYYPEFESGRGFFVNTKDIHIQMGEDVVYCFSDGVITRASGFDGVCAVDAYGINTEELEKGLFDDLKNEKYELLSGQVTVSDMEEVVLDFVGKSMVNGLPEGVGLYIPELSVCKINNTDKYCYKYRIARTYNGIPVEYEAEGSRSFYENYCSRGDNIVAYLATDIVNAYIGCGLSDEWVLDGEKSDKIISITKATELLNNFLPNNTTYNVSKVGLVYFPLSYNETQDNVVVYPCWEYTGSIDNNERMLKYFVNVINGEVYYYAY